MDDITTRRFWDKVSIPLIGNERDKEKCWEWKAADRGNGYGAFKYQGKVISAHVFSFSLNTTNRIKDNLFVCHTCDNPKCVNPRHLFLGSHSDNMKDAFNKGRIAIPTNTQFKKGRTAKNKLASYDTMNKAKEYIKDNPTILLSEVAKIFSIPYRVLIDSRRTKQRSYYNN